MATQKSSRRSRRAKPDVVLGREIRAAMARLSPPLAMAELVRRLTARTGKTWTTTRIADYCSGVKEPNASALLVMCEILNTSADRLLTGLGPAERPSGVEDPCLEDQLAAAVRHRVFLAVHDTEGTRPPIGMGGELSHIAVDGRQLLDQIAERAETAFRHQWAQAQDAAVRDAVLERTAGALSMFAEKRTSAAHRPRAQAAMRILNAQAESVLRSPQAGAVGVAPDGLAFLRNRALPQTIKLAADVLVRAAETDKQRRAD